jgi:hypothetical protein
MEIRCHTFETFREFENIVICVTLKNTFINDGNTAIKK